MTTSLSPQGGPLGDTYVALDLETTGLSSERDEIIEVGAVRYQGGREAATLSTLVNPRRAIPTGVRVLTGIRQEDVDAAPNFDAVASNLQAFIGMAPVVGHNVSFDLAFLARKGLRPSGPAYDTLDLAALLMPRLPEYSLVALSRRLDAVHDRPHRALSDAQATMEVFLSLVSRALLL
ncbi:MAG: 3'-5' exonuclease, partial [Chloroflexota bacterium]